MRSLIQIGGHLHSGGVWGWLVVAFGQLFASSGIVAYFIHRRRGDEVASIRRGWVIAPFGFFLLSWAAAGVAALESSRRLETASAHPSSWGLSPELEFYRVVMGCTAVISILRFHPTGVALIHRTLDSEGIGELSLEVSDVARHLEHAKRQWSIRHPSVPFLGRVSIEAPPDMPLERMAPWLQAAEGAGAFQVFIASRERRVVSTRTVGDIRRDRYCFLPVPIERDFDTWGELARSL